MDRFEQNRARVRSRARDEVGKALQGGAEAGTRKLQRLIDDETKRLAAEDRGPVACAAGCAMCCHVRVAATPPEVFQLLGFLRSHLDDTAFEAFAARTRAAAAAVHALPADGLLGTNIACPVLVDGRCSAYPARPFNCRSYHSLDRAACQVSFDNPADLSLGRPQYAAVARVHEGAQGGFMDALRDAGLDATQRELATALAEALEDPECETRFRRGGPAFSKARTLD